MNVLTKNYKKKIEIEERYKVFLKYQKELEQEGIIPHSPALFLRRYRYLLESISEVLIGFIIAISSVLLVYFVANAILHLEF